MKAGDGWSGSTEPGRLLLTHEATGAVVTWPVTADPEAVARALRVMSGSMPIRRGPLRGREVSLADVSASIVFLCLELGRRPTEDETADRLGYTSRAELSRALRAMLPAGRDRWQRLVDRSLWTALDRLRALSDAAYADEVNEDANA